MALNEKALEIAARAMCRQVEECVAKSGEPVDYDLLGCGDASGFVESYWHNYVSQARAGIEAYLNAP